MVIFYAICSLCETSYVEHVQPKDLLFYLQTVGYMFIEQTKSCILSVFIIMMQFHNIHKGRLIKAK